MDTALSRQKTSAFDKRIHEVDLIRGFLILLVCFDHFMYVLMSNNLQWFEITNIEFFNNIYLGLNFYWRWGLRKIVREFALFGFIFLSGISCAFSKNNWKRAGLMVMAYILVLVVSNLLDALMGSESSRMRIDFNVIGVIAFSVLTYCFFQNKNNRVLAVVSLCLFLFTVVVLPAILAFPGMTHTLNKTVVVGNEEVTIAIENSPTYYLPILWSDNSLCGDWMPLFPYIIYFFLGAMASKIYYVNKVSLFPKKGNWERPFCFCGRHSLWVYAFHLPVLWMIFGLISLIIKAVAN